MPEIVAVVAAILYLAFAIREKIICWLFAAISTAIYIWLFIEARLYMESVLNAFYLVMAGYGWYVWSSGRSDGREKPVVVWPMKTHSRAIAAVGDEGPLAYANATHRIRGPHGPVDPAITAHRYLRLAWRSCPDHQRTSLHHGGYKEYEPEKRAD